MKHSTAFSRNTVIAASLGSSLLLCSAIVAASDQPSGVTLAPSIGYLTHSEKHQGLDDTGSVSFAAGYQFNSPWAVEVAYLMSNPDIINSNQSADSEQLRLDGLYHFTSAGKVTPYAVLGAGRSDISTDAGDVDDTLINAGLGIKYAINNIVSLRSDLRAVNFQDADSTQMAFNVGLNILLGGKHNTKPATAIRQVKDSDKDGVPDNIDSCPGTVANATVDGSGCPVVVDSDGDGVANAVDKCPNTKTGAKVTANGCYQTLKESVQVALNVPFANNSDVVISDSLPQVSELSRFMQQYPLTKVEIKGFTDDRGAASYNQQLSQKRAEAIAKILVNRYNIKADRITAIGYGEAQPIATNATPEGRAKNRRVEALVGTTVERVIK